MYWRLWAARPQRVLATEATAVPDVSSPWKTATLRNLCKRRGLTSGAHKHTTLVLQVSHTTNRKSQLIHAKRWRFLHTPYGADFWFLDPQPDIGKQGTSTSPGLYQIILLPQSTNKRAHKLKNLQIYFVTQCELGYHCTTVHQFRAHQQYTHSEERQTPALESTAGCSLHYSYDKDLTLAVLNTQSNKPIVYYCCNIIDNNRQNDSIGLKLKPKISTLSPKVVAICSDLLLTGHSSFPYGTQNSSGSRSFATPPATQVYSAWPVFISGT